MLLLLCLRRCDGAADELVSTPIEGEQSPVSETLKYNQL